MKNTSFLLFFLFAAQNLLAQEVYTEFTNPSFEDTPRPYNTPYGWWDCGFEGETPPDVHPMPDGGAFGVSNSAHDGSTYLGMVVRENDTWESVGQRLNEPLLPNNCYVITIFLCTSKTYNSQLRGRVEEVSFTDPVLFRVWGGTGFCNKKELLAESTLIDHHDWREYTFRISPTKKHRYIALETFFDTPRKFPPNGNLLLDNLSPIYSVNCNELDTININRPNSNPIEDSIPVTNSNPINDNNSENKVVQYGKSIQFNFDDQLTEAGKFHLKKLVEFATLNNKRLILCVKIKSEYRNSIQIENLKNFMNEYKLSSNQYTLRKVKPSDKTETWFSQNPFLYIGLQDIK